jgi:hypothetical protein
MVMRIAMQDGVQLKLTILRELVAQHLAAALKARDGGELELSEQLIARAISYKEQADSLGTAAKAKVD